MKIAIIGAGGYVFPLRLIGDILSFPALRDCTLSLMDVDLARAERTADAARHLMAHYGFPTRIETTTDRRASLDSAGYVIVTFQVGGLELYRLDVEIPRKYGLDQTVGDTLGPGGVMRFLRSAPALAEIAEDMHALCPDALLIWHATAAVCRTNINVQELAVRAMLDGDREHIYHAIALDPLTGALLTLAQIRQMTDELLQAEAQWLPDFARVTATRPATMLVR